jgi:hypothetical protein
MTPSQPRRFAVLTAGSHSPKPLFLLGSLVFLGLLDFLFLTVVSLGHRNTLLKNGIGWIRALYAERAIFT